MVKSKAKKAKAKEKKPEPLVTDKGISHYEMAQYIMKLATFKTFHDTRQILIYSTKTGRYRFNGDATIKNAVEKTLIKHNLGWQATTHYMNEVLGHIERSTYVSSGKFNSSSH